MERFWVQKEHETDVEEQGDVLVVVLTSQLIIVLTDIEVCQHQACPHSQSRKMKMIAADNKTW